MLTIIYEYLHQRSLFEKSPIKANIKFNNYMVIVGLVCLWVIRKNGFSHIL